MALGYESAGGPIKVGDPHPATADKGCNVNDARAKGRMIPVTSPAGIPDIIFKTN